MRLSGETDRAGSDWFLRKFKYEPALVRRERGYGGCCYHVPTFLARAPIGGIQLRVSLAPHPGKLR